MRRLSLVVVALASGAAILATAPVPARACPVPAHTPHVVDAAMQALDTVPPDLAGAELIEVVRGRDSPGCGDASSSCDDLGAVILFTSVSDDMTPPDRIGYRISLVAGTPPPGFEIPAGPIDIEQNMQNVRLSWNDGAMDNQDAIDFTISVVAVDLAGNESPARTVSVQDDGVPTNYPTPAGECRVSTRRGSPLAGACIGALALLIAARRRRTPRGRAPGSGRRREGGDSDGRRHYADRSCATPDVRYGRRRPR